MVGTNHGLPTGSFVNKKEQFYILFHIADMQQMYGEKIVVKI